MSVGPKYIAEQCHKLGVLADLTITTIDNLKPLFEPGDNEINSETPILRLKELLEEVGELCGEVLNNIYSVKDVRSSTYMVDLSKSVDTCIRKNFKPMN